jgi:hypothetical protein
MCIILATTNEVLITIWPNRDDSNHVLIIPIDVDSQKTNDQDDLFFDPPKNREALDL